MDETRENEITGQKGGGKGRGHRDEREGGTSTTQRTHPKLPIWSNRNGTITVRSTITLSTSFYFDKNLIAEKCELHRRPKLDSCLLRGNARDFFDNIGIADFGLFGHLSQNTIQHQS